MLTRIFAAALFALLVTTAPAHAGAVAVEDINLNFGNGYTADGRARFFVPGMAEFGPDFSSPNPLHLSFNGSSLDLPFYLHAGLDHFFYSSPTGPFLFDLVGFGFPPNFVFSDFSLNGVTAVSGNFDCISISVVGGSGTCPVSTPLPAALPLFGSGVMMLAGLAWRSGGRFQRDKRHGPLSG
jgi:hypothetical protein